MQIKTTMKPPTPLTMIAILKMTEINKYQQGCGENWNPYTLLVEMYSVATLDSSLVVPQKFKHII